MILHSVFRLFNVVLKFYDCIFLGLLNVIVMKILDVN